MRLPPDVLAGFRLVRLPAVFTAISNSIAAQLIATGGEPVWPAMVWLVLASSALYMAGMVLNDCFDVEEDRRDRPGRPLPSGAVSAKAAWTMGWLLLAAGIVFASMAGLRAGVVAALLACAIVAYDGWLKSSPVASVAMAACRYLNWLLGFSVVALTGSAFLLALPVFVYVLALTLLSRVETTASDRRAVAVCAGVMILLALLLVAFLFSGLLPNIFALPFVALGLYVVLHRMLLTWRAFTPENIQRTVGLLVMGVIPLDALMLLAAGQLWGSLLVLALLLPGRLLSRWLYVT